MLRVSRHSVWSPPPYTSKRTAFAVDVFSTNSCTCRGRFKYRPRRFKLVIDCSVGFCMSLANSFVEYDRSRLSCDKYAALITTLRHCLVRNASNSGNVANISSSMFLTDGVVTPFALSKIQRLGDQLGVSKIWFVLSPPPFTIRVPAHMSIQDSYLLGVIATSTQDGPNLLSCNDCSSRVQLRSTLHSHPGL